VVVDHHELEAPGGRDRLTDVRELVEEVARGRVDHLDVGGVAAGAAALEEIGEERRRHARFGRVRSDGQRADAVASRRAVLVPELPPGTPTFAVIAASATPRGGTARRGPCARSVPAVERRGLRRPELDRQSPDGLRRNARDRRRPFGVFLIPFGLAIRYERYEAPRALRGQVSVVEAEHVEIEIGLVLQPSLAIT